MTKSLLTCLLMSVTLCGCAGEASKSGEPMAIAVEKRSWSGATSSGQQLISNHYEIFTSSVNTRLVTSLNGFMEAGYRNYVQMSCLQERPLEEKLSMYVMGTRKEWSMLTMSIVKQNVGLYLSIDAGGYCYQNVCVLWDMGGLGTLSVAAHEGFHQFMHIRLADQLPMWLEEGLCTCAEGFQVDGDRVSFTPSQNVIRFGDLRTAIVQGRMIPVAKLLTMDAGDAIGGEITEHAVGYYGQLWGLVNFLQSREDYRQGLARFMADAEAGKLHVAMGAPSEALARLRRAGRIYNRVVGETLFRHYISDDLAGFEREYQAYCRKLTKLE